MSKFYLTITRQFRQNVSTSKSSETNRKLWIHRSVSSAKPLLMVCLILCFMIGFQKPSSAQTINKGITASVPAAEGTYQLIFNRKSEDKEIKLSQGELISIENLRKENEIVYARATYSDDIRVRILPRSTISSKGFSPVPLKYFKEEHSYEEYSHIKYVDLQ